MNALPTNREELLNHLTNILTVNEAAALTARINAKNYSSKARRFGLFPITDFGSYERQLRLEASYWDATETKFNKDIDSFNSLTRSEQKALLTAFAFFAVGDGTISSMLAYQMIVSADNFESQCYYVTQLNNEKTHGHTYSNMIQTLVASQEERDAIFNAVDNVPAIQNMNDYIEKSYTFTDGKKQLYISLACAEYIFFTPLFCIIFWFRANRPGEINNVLLANELIAKDEAEHCRNGCEKYKELSASEKYSDSEIHAVVDTVVQLVSKLAEYMFVEQGIQLSELTYENVCQYIQFIADDLLTNVHHERLYNVTNPFPWMVYTQMPRKTNFYEGDVTEYKRFDVREHLDNMKKLNNKFNKIDGKEAVPQKKKVTKF